MKVNKWRLPNPHLRADLNRRRKYMQDENKPKRPSVYDLTVGADVILTHGALIEGEEEIAEWYALIDDWADKSEDKLTALRVVKKLALKRIDSLKLEIALFKGAIVREERTVDAMDDKAMSVMESFHEVTGKTKASTSDGGWVGIRTYKSEKVNIIDESVIPDGFMDVKRVPMRAELLSALKKDQDIPGVELERSERRGVQWGKMK
tara:strand:+ start:718 stop:1335 length:618 start_codon:yes stop_codon:yes gene_type:complete